MITLLDCGHEESPHSSITRGYATRPDGSKICYVCAEAEEREELKTATAHTAYLTATEGPHGGVSCPRHILTGWPGWKIATVTHLWQTSAGGFCRGQKITRFRAVDVHGQHWYGTSPGVGMYARMHKVK